MDFLCVQFHSTIKQLFLTGSISEKAIFEIFGITFNW